LDKLSIDRIDARLPHRRKKHVIDTDVLVSALLQMPARRSVDAPGFQMREHSVTLSLT
jgi:hypothetical protein